MQQPVLLFSGLVLNVILGGPRDNTLSTQTKIKKSSVMQQPVLLFSGLVLNVILGGPRDNTLSTQTKIKSIYETGEISC
ncbi:hypothetical protein ABG067_005216 [Albugo candida]